MDEKRLPLLVRDLYRIVGELEAMFPGRRFTPDGHMVGSLGECLVAHYYGITLHPASHPGHDGIWNGLHVQIKTTQGDSVAFRSEPQHLIVIRLDKQGGFEEIYNGPGGPTWDLVRHKPKPSNGQLQVSLASLRKLMVGVTANARVPTLSSCAASANRTGSTT